MCRLRLLIDLGQRSFGQVYRPSYRSSLLLLYGGILPTRLRACALRLQRYASFLTGTIVCGTICRDVYGRKSAFVFAVFVFELRGQQASRLSTILGTPRWMTICLCLSNLLFLVDFSMLVQRVVLKQLLTLFVLVLVHVSNGQGE